MRLGLAHPRSGGKGMAKWEGPDSRPPRAGLGRGRVPRGWAPAGVASLDDHFTCHHS